MLLSPCPLLRTRVGVETMTLLPLPVLTYANMHVALLVPVTGNPAPSSKGMEGLPRPSPSHCRLSYASLPLYYSLVPPRSPRTLFINISTSFTPTIAPPAKRLPRQAFPILIRSTEVYFLDQRTRFARGASREESLF